MSNKADLSPDIAVLFGLLLAETIDTRGLVPVVNALHAVRYPDCDNSPDPSSTRPHGTVDGDILGGFDIALQKLRDGYGVRRRGCNGAGLTVRMQVPDAHSKMTLPYLYIEYPATHPVTPGARCPWLASQTDLCATDCELVVP